jgi:hypothetical protein
MLTATDIEGKTLAPLSQLLAVEDVPGDLIGFDADLGALLDQVLFTDASFQPVENGYLGKIVLVLPEEVALAPFGDVVHLVLGGSGTLTVCEVELSLETRPGGFYVRLSLLDVAVILRVDGAILRPLVPGTSEPDPAATTLDVSLGTVTLELSTERPVMVEFDSVATVPRCMLGDTGIIVSVGGIRWLTPGSEDLPAETPPDFTGLHLDDVTTELASLELAGNATLRLDYAFVGRGGVTAAAALEQLDLAGSLAGFEFHLDAVRFTLVQSALTECAISGSIVVPFFDRAVAVELSLAADGSVQVGIAQSGPGGVVELAVPGVGTFGVASLALGTGDAGASLGLGGELQLTVGSPMLTWPGVTIDELVIGPDGRITIAGVWIDLQQPLALDLYGFTMEITRIGFGTEEDGRRWVGFDGGLRLTELLPAGASAKGLRVIWDPARPTQLPEIRLEGVGIYFGVPGVFTFEGEVALTEDPATGAKLFTGELKLALEALDVGVDAGIAIGQGDGYTYVFVFLGVDLPVPIAATGTALYGMRALFAMNMSPTVQDGDWYDWYKTIPGFFQVTDPNKWSADPGAWAFGAGLSIGTLADAGYSVNTKALLVVLLPGPVILIEGKADLFTIPAEVGSATQEGTLSLLAALDGRAGTLQLGIDAAWALGRVIDIAASTDAFFDFDRLDAWHLWVGQDDPESARIRAEILALFVAESWLMLDADGVATGMGVSFGDSWKFGPVRLTLTAWIAAQAALSWRPAQLSGSLGLGGEAGIEVGPFGVGIAVEAGLGGQTPTPYLVAGTLSVVVELPKPLKDLDVDIQLEWREDATPTVADPWSGALLEHERCTESWPATIGGSIGADPADDAPVVPLDARVLLSFTQPMDDETSVADNPPAAAPVVPIGKHEATYTLAALALHRRRRSHPGAGWEDVTDTVFGTWTVDAGDAGTRLQLFSRSPFAFTRFTSRRWTDSFLAAHQPWPCDPPPPAVRSCVDWRDVPVGTRTGSLWTESGATFTTNAPLEVYPGGGPGDHELALLPADVGGFPQPGVLWVGLPEPVAEVTASVMVNQGDRVTLRAWRGDRELGSDHRDGGRGELRVEPGTGGIEAVTVEWGFSVESRLVSLCWVTSENADALAAWDSRQEALETAAERWSSAEPVFDPDSHYLLEVTTRAVLREGSSELQRVERSHAVQFQTGGPPGVPPEWVADPPPAEANTSGRFPHGGVLADLAGYVRWTIPDPGAAAVFRAYDPGCEFDADHVQQMYGADLRVRLRDDNGAPVLDATGAELVFENAWEEAPTTTLSTDESAWLSRLDACTGAVQWTSLSGDLRVRTQVPGLLYDDFSGDLATAWTTVVLDPAEPRGANWHLDGGVLRQDVDLAGGTVYLSEDVDAADVALETVAWAGSGAYGLVFRWQANGDHYRFSVEPHHQRLVAVQGGAIRELWSSRDGYQQDAATRLVVQTEGQRIRCQVDERLVCDVADPDPNAPATGSVGLYTAASATAAFDEVRARPWPGTGLAPERGYVADLEVTRPLFTDAFEDLEAFEIQYLLTGAPASGSSASTGTAIIAPPPVSASAVVALAGDPNAGDYVVECNARPAGQGSFGLVARHGAAGCLVLQLEPGEGRTLVARLSASPDIFMVRVLWQDSAAVEVGRDYALSLRCEGDTITVSIDGEEVTVDGGGLPERGRFGLLSGISTPAGCAFTDLVVRSAPRVAVHHWRYTTSRHLGLPELLDTFAGRTWPVAEAAPAGAAVEREAAAAAAAIADAQAILDGTRSALAVAVDAGNAVELAGLRAATRAAADSRCQVGADAYLALAAALGLPWRPLPPVVEVCTVDDAGSVLALLLELPEPLPRERMGLTLTGPSNGDERAALDDLVAAWSEDGCRAILARHDGLAFTAGMWSLDLALHFDVGVERALWRRGGSTAPEVGTLRFRVE